MTTKRYEDVKLIGTGESVITAIRPDLPDLVEGSRVTLIGIIADRCTILVDADPEEHTRISDHLKERIV